MEYAELKLVEHNGKFYFESPELAATHIGKGPIRTKRDAFMMRFGLRRSSSRKFPDWGAITPVERRGEIRVKYTNSFTANGEFAIMGKSSVVDHEELFTGGGYVYATQPYDLSLDLYQSVENLWLGLGLFVDISYLDAWHYPGRTPLVVISQRKIELTK